MPHYADGTPAQVGDLVKGVSYNLQGRLIVGTVIQITEDTDSCNCVIAYVDILSLPGAPLGGGAHMEFQRAKGGRTTMSFSGERETIFIVPYYDYGALKDFEKVTFKEATAKV